MDDESLTPEGQMFANIDKTMAETFAKMEAEPEAEQGAIGGNVAEQPAIGQTRDATGKFAKVEAATSTEGAPTEATETETTDKGAIDTAAAAGPSKPPQSLSAAAKAIWPTLPPEIQQEWLKRESDVAKGFEQRATELKQFDGIRQVLTPRAQELTQEFGSVPAAIDEMFKVADYCKNDTRGFLRDVAAEAGLTIRFADEADGGATGAETPQLAAYANRLQNIERAINEQRHAQQTQEMQQAAVQVERFAKDHPHLETVRVEMGKLINAGIANSMEDAYDRAVYSNPQLRDAVIQEKMQAQTKAAAEAAAKARKAAGTSISSVGSPNGVKQPMTMDQTMAAVYDQMNP